jgi:hypothetical protein
MPRVEVDAAIVPIGGPWPLSHERHKPKPRDRRVVIGNAARSEKLIDTYQRFRLIL